MSELRSVVDALRSEVLSSLPDARIEEDFAELQAVMDQLEVERLRRLAEIERRGIHRRDGHLSAASWLASTQHLAWGTAREQVWLARGLEEMLATRSALEAGELSMSQARVLAGARQTDPEAFSRSEEVLVQAARIHTMNDLQKVVSYWRERVEPDRGLDVQERLRARRGLHASVTFGAMVRLDGELDPESGETLLAALGGVLDAEARSGEPDERTPAQRRADALTEICRGWLDREDRPTVAGERPHLTLTVPLGAFARGSEEPGELDHAGPVAPETVRRLACDASVMRVVVSGTSEPLDVGRRTAVVPPAMRRAVIVRDRHCRFPGCDRPHTWCDAHHVVHWADGGSTSVPNLILLCRRHHRLVHERGGFGLELVEGRGVFRRPDGSVLEDRAPP
jgi:hypothetical protein